MAHYAGNDQIKRVLYEGYRQKQRELSRSEENWGKMEIPFHFPAGIHMLKPYNSKE
jgi:hypothetical protein